MIIPEDYKNATPEQRKEVCNGCGGGGWASIIPDKLFGVSVEEACNIHDWMYVYGYSKKEADVTFLYNLTYLIHVNPWLFIPRFVLVTIYFLAVKYLGHGFYKDAVK